MYSFEYDPLDRLADSRHYLNASPFNSFEEKNISYDLNGNILTMTRVGESGDENEVTYSYSGNQLTSSIYDLNGNITYDVTSGLTMEWNHLDLIKKISNNSGVLINYTYLSDGTKVRSVDASGEGLEYRGSLTFRRSSDGTLTPENIAFPGGRFIAMQGADGSIQMVPNYHIADHLGSVRTIVNGSTGQVVETNDYYAFGSRWDRSGSLIDQSNRYRYNSKEEQATFGTPYSDYGARQYSSASGRWLTVDPLAEKYYSYSPYAFCNNNPVNLVDPDGKFPVALPLLPIVLKAAVAAGGLTLTIWAAGKFGGSYSSSKYNPGYEHQKEEDRRNKRALDQAQLNVQNSINNNFPDPNQHDPNDGPNMKRGSNFKKAAFLSLALIGGNHEFLKELIKNFLLNDEGEEKGEEKKEIDTDANVEVFVSPTPKEEQDKLDEQTEGINYIYHFLWDQGLYPEYFVTY